MTITNGYNASCQFHVYISFSVFTTAHTDLLFCTFSNSFVSLSLLQAPPGIDPLEHEELPMTVQQARGNVKPTPTAVPQMSTEMHHGAFGELTVLPLSFSIKPNDTVSLYRARLDNRNVILRMLKGKLSCSQPNPE